MLTSQPCNYFRFIHLWIVHDYLDVSASILTASGNELLLTACISFKRNFKLTRRGIARIPGDMEKLATIVNGF